jgi:hypothetical protein
MFWAQRKAKRIDYEKTGYRIRSSESWKSQAIEKMKEMDIVGLLLVASSLGLVLLPLTLANTADRGWDDPLMGGMVSRQERLTLTCRDC